jgi:DNA polymerase-4
MEHRPTNRDDSGATIRKIIHVDMDAFYASVEQRDRPDLRGRPVVVGGSPDSRGVVAACSYEARKFGIHSAMPCSRAYRLCRQAVFIRPRFDTYKAVSLQIRDIFHRYTHLVEPLSLDEAYLDVTRNRRGIPSATRIAEEIRQQIFTQTGGLTASAGISFNKFLAKVASDCNKPDGITVITPRQAPAFIDALPVRKFFGVGKVTEEKMLALGLKTGADLKRLSRRQLKHHFGKAGSHYFDIVNGRDGRPVKPDHIRKSIGKETTLAKDIDDRDRMREILGELALRVADLLAREKRKAFTVTLKLRYHDFQTVTRSTTLSEPVTDAAAIMARIDPMLSNTEAGRKKVRLLGISVSNFPDARQEQEERAWVQLPLPFEAEPIF